MVVALVLLLVLGGGGTAAYLLVAGRAGGASSPAAAVDGFLGAVFTLHSAKDAAGFVCPRARDDGELDQVVFGVKTFEKDYPSARTTWTYPEITPSDRGTLVTFEKLLPEPASETVRRSG